MNMPTGGGIVSISGLNSELMPADWLKESRIDADLVRDCNNSSGLRVISNDRS
jgi:hypothetical protein